MVSLPLFLNMRKKILHKATALKNKVLDIIHTATHRPKFNSFAEATEGLDRIFANLRAASRRHDAVIAENVLTIQNLNSDNWARQIEAARCDRVVARLEELLS
jgi:hypothetical protein